MKRVLILIFLMGILLSACTNKPEEVNLDATIQAAVDTAVAPYVNNDYVTADELTDSQKAQNIDIQQYISDQLVNSKLQNGESIDQSDGTTESAQQTTPQPAEQKQITQTVVVDSTNCVDAFEYVADVNWPDGSDIPVETVFTKSWYIKNTGSCVWNSDYKLKYVSGDKVYTQEKFDILKSGQTLSPGESMVISAQIQVPNEKSTTFTTHWGISTPKNTIIGADPINSIYLISSFYATDYFNFAHNFATAVCSDDEGVFTCGVNSDGRGRAFFSERPTLESQRTGQPSIVIAPPKTMGGITRVKFGPIRMHVNADFYCNISCRPNTTGCDDQVRLYIQEAGYPEEVKEEMRQWNDGFVQEWKFKLSDRYIFYQDYYYIFEVQANGMGDDDDEIIIMNPRVF